MTEDIFKILEELKILIKELPRPTTEKEKREQVKILKKLNEIFASL